MITDNDETTQFTSEDFAELSEVEKADAYQRAAYDKAEAEGKLSKVLPEAVAIIKAQQQARLDLARCVKNSSDFAEMQRQLDKLVKVNAGDVRDLEAVFTGLQERKFDAAKPVEEIPALVYLGDTPIIRQRNISTLTAHNGMGKTHVLAAIMRAITHNERALGFTGNIDGAVAYVDFEQSLDDFDAAMRFQAGATSADNLVPYHLTGLSPKDARAAIQSIVAREPNLRLLIIDGYADCVSSPNAEDECNEFIKELLFAANERNLAILGVLHLNPGQAAKSRGHLGSEVERKSETVLQIDHNSKDDTRELWTRKARKKPIAEGSGVRFQWSDDDKCFVEIDGTKKEAREAEKVTEWRIELDEVIEHTGATAWRYSDLKNAIQDVTKKSAATAKNRIKDWVNSGILQQDKANGSYHT